MEKELIIATDPMIDGRKEPSHTNGVSTDQTWHAPDDGKRVPKEVYWESYYEHGDASYEWNNGILEAKPLPTKVQLSMYRWFFILLSQFLDVYQKAEMIALETGFTMTVPDLEKPLSPMKETVRKPDIGVVRDDNPVLWGDDERSYWGICDLCVESMSDSTEQEVERDTQIKKFEYEFSKVKEYFILDPANKHMHFYRLNASGVYVEIQPDANGVIRSEVLPGFQFRLSDLWRKPSLEEMALDEVYRGYILPKYQAAEARVQQAEQEREHERLRAEQAEQTNEMYAAKLRELGIDPKDLEN